MSPNILLKYIVVGMVVFVIQIFKFAGGVFADENYWLGQINVIAPYGFARSITNERECHVRLIILKTKKNVLVKKIVF